PGGPGRPAGRGAGCRRGRSGTRSARRCTWSPARACAAAPAPWPGSGCWSPAAWRAPTVGGRPWRRGPARGGCGPARRGGRAPRSGGHRRPPAGRPRRPPPRRPRPRAGASGPPPAGRRPAARCGPRSGSASHYSKRMTDPDAVLRRLTDRLAPLERDLHQALWAAATDARPSASAARQRTEEAWLAALGGPELFAEVQGALAASDGAAGRRTRRALEQASLDLLANQVPEADRAQLVALQAKVEHAFATVRGRVGDRELANNELERVLADSTDPAQRRAAWEAGKQVGAVVADDVLALVELRNRVARERGS